MGMDTFRAKELRDLLKTPLLDFDDVGDEALHRYDQALTHSSWTSEQKQIGVMCEDYEQLEFLGDCILDFIIAEELYSSFQHRARTLYERFPDKTDESLLTDMLHDTTNDKKLAEIVVATRIFDACIRRGTGQELNDSIRAGALEAFIAAVYYHKGITGAQQLIHRLFRERIEHAEPITSWKNKLQECVQKKFLPPDVRTILQYHEPVPENGSTYVSVQVSVNKETWGEGRAGCKRDAEIEAAKNAYETHCQKAGGQ
ncbi:MAG: putative dsRNA-binding protein [Methanoregula sp.]|nr:putative dsRNA-binding protein [Methanoregula sp.]